MATNPQEVTVVNVTTTQQAKNILHDAKQDFVSKELRDPIIQKLNRNDTHYDDNNYVLDLFFYMRNNHPFLSLFCVHPKHPYSQGKRFLVSFVTWSLAFLLAALWELIDSGADHFYYQTIISGFLLFLFGTFLSVTAQCSCTQSDKVMKGVRNTASCVSSVLLCQCCCLGLCFAIAGILLVVRPWQTQTPSVTVLSPSSSSNSGSSADKFDATHFVENFLGAKVMDYVLWSPLLLTATFHCKRGREMAKL